METSKEPTFQLLSAPDFIPEKFVKQTSQTYVGGSELQNLRKKIHALSEETSNSLKKNVYQNYVQFIDTAKEISHLESEMYQLSHLLSEQKALLNALSNTSILETKTHIAVERENKMDERDIEEENKQKINSILEKVEGCRKILDIPGPGRTLLHEGDLLEIDPTENTTLKTVHAYLFSDGLMLCNRNPNQKELMKYIYETIYELGSLAVVNVRDLGNVKHAFKLLIFPDTRVFQCSSNSNKKEWLDHFDQAKKNRLTQDQHKRESAVVEKTSPSRSLSIESHSINPFDDFEDDSGNIHPEWFLDIPDELDVCLAQRHFEETLTILQKSKEYIKEYTLKNNQTDHILNDIQRKIEQKQNNLIEMLMKELEVNPGKSLQGGLRATRRAVRLLNQLDRSTQACDLFLKLCSSMLKTQYKRVKKEGSTTMYARHLSSVVFTNMCHMSDEFLRAFPNSSSCASAYVVWASHELSLFTAHFSKQVFVPQSSLSVITDCVVLMRDQCERLCNYGIDFRYQLNGALRSPLTKALRDARDKIIDSVKLRALDDKWFPMNLSTKSGLAKCLHEYSQMGLNLEDYVTGDVWVQLTPSTMNFCKIFLPLLDNCLKLQTAELLHTIDETLYNVIDAQARHCEQSLRNELQEEQRNFITKNAEFVLVKLVDLTQKKYKEVIGYDCQNMVRIRSEYAAILKGVSPTSRSVKTKYSSEFL